MGGESSLDEWLQNALSMICIVSIKHQFLFPLGMIEGVIAGIQTVIISGNSAPTPTALQHDNWRTTDNDNKLTTDDVRLGSKTSLGWGADQPHEPSMARSGADSGGLDTTR